MMRTIFTLMADILLMMSCSGITSTGQTTGIYSLPDRLQLGHNLLLRDSVTTLDFPFLTLDQRRTLQFKSGIVVPDSTRAIGARQVAGKYSLEAYLVPLSVNPDDFKILLTTRGSDGYSIHTIDLGRFHTCEYQGRPRLGGNRYYTTDAELMFTDETHFTLHRVMTLTSLYLKDHSTHEMWRVEWDDRYEIDSNGYFIFKSQQETLRSPADLNDPVINDYQSRTLTI